MNIPQFAQTKFVDESGFLTPPWQQFFAQLIQEMNNNLSNEGFSPPSQPSTNLTALQKKSDGTILWSTTENCMKMNVNGSYKTVITL